jgi:predicted  nucleic acid-binding Zn-ribbon protein
MLNVCHQRGDLAALFIEGGSGSLNQLFLGNTEEKEDVEVANVHGWYKEGKKFLKTAVADGEFRDLKDRVTSIKDDIRSIKKDDKDFESRIKKLEKTIDDLNIGSRRFFQQQDIFNSLQRKIERVDTVMQEWSNYKKEMDDNIRRQVEKHTKARIGDITPKAY